MQNKKIAIVASEPVSEYKNFNDPLHGITLKYPKGWQEEKCGGDCILKLNYGKLFDFYPEGGLFLAATSTSEENNAEKKIGNIQKIIDADYYTPAGVGGVGTNYSRESFRYSISNFKNKNEVQFYHYDYVGKYSYVDSGYFFNTPKGYTIIMGAEIPGVVRKSGEIEFAPEFSEFIDSIKFQ